MSADNIAILVIAIVFTVWAFNELMRPPDAF